MTVPLPFAESSACVSGSDPSTERLGKLVCQLPSSVHDFAPLARRWPYVLAALALIAAGWWTWRALRRKKWTTHAVHGVWLEIVAPVTATPATTADLWRLLARLLTVPSRMTLRPKRIVFEAYAQPDRMRAGIWVPPAIPALHVTQKITQAWPGARVTQTSPPRLPDDTVLHGVRLAPAGPDCVDYVPSVPAGHEGERQRAVYDALASGGRSGGALMQIVVQGPPKHRFKIFGRAIADPAKVSAPGAARVLDAITRALHGLLNGVAGLLRSGPPPAAGKAHLSEEMIERRERARAKRQARPHLLAGVRIFTSGADRAEARATADNIACGYALVAPELGTRRLHQPAKLAASRWAPESHLVLSSITEVAALAGLPAESATFGLPQSASRRRAPTADAFSPRNDEPGEDRPRFDPWGMA